MIPEILNKTSVDEIFSQVEIDESFWFTKNFGPSKNHPEQILSWLVYVGDKGMAPVISRGAQSPVFKGDGLYEMLMRGAMVSEKTYFTEEEINATLSKDPLRREAAEFVIVERNEELVIRDHRRVDWLGAQIFFNKGVVSYRDKSGTVWALDYLIPKSHIIEDLGTNMEWATGSARDPVKDIDDMKLRIKLDSGGEVTKLFINSKTLNSRLRNDDKIQSFLSKSAFGIGDLLTKPAAALSSYLDVEIVKYDEFIPHTVRLIQRIDASNYFVDDPWLLKAGTEVKFLRTDETGLQTYLEELNEIDSINLLTGQIELVSPMDQLFNQRDDRLRCIIPFLPDDHVILLAEKARGKKICQWIDAPLGYPSRYGIRSDVWENKDPDVVFTRAQRLGLWALYNNQAFSDIYVG